MGLYDNVLEGSKTYQVKCWDNPYLRDFEISQEVPRVNGEENYSVLLMEDNRYLNVTEQIITSISDKPKHSIIFSKWGDNISNNDLGTYYENEHPVKKIMEKVIEDLEKT